MATRGPERFRVTKLPMLAGNLPPLAYSPWHCSREHQEKHWQRSDVILLKNILGISLIITVSTIEIKKFLECGEVW